MTPLAARIAAQIARHVLDLRFARLDDAAEAAAHRILAEPAISAGLRALPVLAALETRHQPRTWVGGTATVCEACNVAWPCETKQILDSGLAAHPERDAA